MDTNLPSPAARVRSHLLSAKAIKPETEYSICQRVAAYGAATEDLGDSMQQTAAKLCCMVREEMREFRSQVSFAAPLVTGIKVVRGDVQRGIPNLRQLVARNRREMRSKRRQAEVYQVTTRSAKDAELPVERTDAESSEEATEASDCVPLLPVESGPGGGGGADPGHVKPCADQASSARKGGATG